METGSVDKYRPRSGRPVTASGDDKIEEVRQVITEDPTVSIRKLSIRLATKRSRTRSLTVWALISCQRLISWIIQEETMNTERYRENVLIPNVIPFFTHGTGTSMIFQQDGVSAHYELNVRNLLDEQFAMRSCGHI